MPPAPSVEHLSLVPMGPGVGIDVIRAGEGRDQRAAVSAAREVVLDLGNRGRRHRAGDELAGDVVV
jgi:hypothetical protein